MILAGGRARLYLYRTALPTAKKGLSLFDIFMYKHLLLYIALTFEVERLCRVGVLEILCQTNISELSSSFFLCISRKSCIFAPKFK